MKKWIVWLLVLFMLIAPLMNLNLASADIESKTYVVTANSACVFSAPQLDSNLKISTLTHKDEIEVEIESGMAKEYGEGLKFYHITNMEKDGYVLAELVIPKNQYLQSIPKFNAKTNSKAKVYFLDNENYVESDIILPKHQRIFLYEGFNRKRDYIAVCFVYDNEVIYGYLQESKIDPDGINPLIITCICVILAVLGIVFALVFMKKKKGKKIVAKNK